MTACGTGTGNGKMQTGSAPATRQPTKFITGTWAWAQGCFIGTYAHPERQYSTCHWSTSTVQSPHYRITGAGVIQYTMVCKATSKPTCQSSTCTSSTHVLKSGSPKCATDPCVTDETACCEAASSVGHAAVYSTIEAISGSVGTASTFACESTGGSAGSWESIKSETA